MNKQSMKRYTVKRTVAWLLVICIVFASFAGADVYAADDGGEETYSGLRVKEWLRYDDNGELIMNGSGPGDMDEEGNTGDINDTDCKGVQLPGEAIWIDLVTFKGDKDSEEEPEITGRQHISMNNSITVDYYGETYPYDDGAEVTENVNGTVKANENDSRLVDFTPEYTGYYLLSYEEYSLVLDVRYPDVAFYKEANVSLDSLLHDGYDYGRFSYYHGKTENSVYFYLYNKTDSNGNSHEVTLAGCEDEDEDKATFVLSFWDDGQQQECKKYGGDSGIESYFNVEEVSGKNGWYKIIFDEDLKNGNNTSIDSFYLRINAKVTETWQEDGVTETSSYDAGSGLDVKCYSSGLYAMDFDNQHDFYTESGADLNPAHKIIRLKNVSVNADGEAYEEFLTDISKIKVYIWEDNGNGGEQWSAEPVNDEYVEYKTYEGGSGYFDFVFYREGRYGITDGNGNFITIHAWLPAFGFYKEPERPDGGGKVETLLTGYNILEGQTDSFYMVTWFDDMNPDCPDMETFKMDVYDENNKDVSRYIDYSKEIRDEETGALLGYEVKILKEATGSFRLVASGKTVSSYYVVNEEGEMVAVGAEPYGIDNEIWVVCIPLSEIKITTPPLKTVYTEGEKFDPSGMKVTAVYENGDEREISSQEYETSIKDALSTDNKDITITYHNKTVKLGITVNAKKVPVSSGGTGSYINLNPPASPEPAASPEPTASPALTASPEPTASPALAASPEPAASQTPAASLEPVSPVTSPEPDEPASEPGVTVKPDVPIKAGDSVKDDKTGVYKITKIASNGTPVIVYTPNKAAKKAKSITIKSTVKINGKNYKVTKIADNALMGNKNLKKVIIPASITVIGKNAFKDCQKLKSIVLPPNVKKICNSAFKGCSSLKDVTIESSKIKSIEKNSFKNLAKGVVIKIPKAKKTIYKKMLMKAGYTGKIKFV